jgi:hypothetical protein
MVQSLLDQAKALLFAVGVTGVPDLLSYLGFLGADVPGVLQVLKWLKGQRPEATSVQPNGSIQIINPQGDVFVVTAPVATLVNNARVVAGIEKMAAPLLREGVERLEVRHGADVVESVDKSEARYLAIPQPTPGPDEEDMGSSESEGVYQVTRPSFRERLTWTLYDGANSYNVKVTDEDFLARVDRDEITFAAHDALRVRLRRQTRRTSSGTLRTEYEVPRVMEVIPAPRMRQLPLPAPPAPPSPPEESDDET